jgi:hypothetical protein
MSLYYLESNAGNVGSRCAGLRVSGLEVGGPRGNRSRCGRARCSGPDRSRAGIAGLDANTVGWEWACSWVYRRCVNVELGLVASCAPPKPGRDAGTRPSPRSFLRAKYTRPLSSLSRVQTQSGHGSWEINRPGCHKVSALLGRS